MLKIVDASVMGIEMVVGSDPEHADMGNPQGLIYRRRFVVLATTAEGRRFAHHHPFQQELTADILAGRVRGRGEINLAHWTETYEVYGSSAWEAADRQRQFEHAANPANRGVVRDY